MANRDEIAALRDAACIVGIGETDYALDYERHRGGAVSHDSYGYAATAFARALADSGVNKGEIDAVVTAGPISDERICEVLGVNPAWTASADAGRAVIQAATWIASGLANTVALIYGNNQRSGGTQYGGPRATGGDGRLSYVYYAPWGMTSQGALYAMMFRRHMGLYGTTQEELGHIAVAERRWAESNPNAVMRKPMDIDAYLAARYVCEPLRLFDYCLVNDGGVCLIMTRPDRAADLAQPPVYVSGFASAELDVDATQLRPRMVDFYRPAHDRVRAQVYEMSGVAQGDIDALQVYDSFTCHVLFALEGFGFCSEGEGGAFVATGALGPGGALPVNTSGGMLSESYMQGWNHQAEIARQLRGQAGARQLDGCSAIQYISDASGKCASIIYRND
jgi:acetyl-CoA acetyltransferase